MNTEKKTIPGEFLTQVSPAIAEIQKSDTSLETQQAAARLQRYIDRRKKFRGLDVNVIHTIDGGDSSEASLMLSDIEILLAVVAK